MPFFKNENLLNTIYAPQVNIITVLYNKLDTNKENRVYYVFFRNYKKRKYKLLWIDYDNKNVLPHVAQIQGIGRRWIEEGLSILLG